jgi:hypothetical protein
MTEFPWSKVSVKTGNAIAMACDTNDGVFEKCQFPMSCEDLIEAGWKSVAELKFIGPQAINSIDCVLKELGFMSFMEGD